MTRMHANRGLDRSDGHKGATHKDFYGDITKTRLIVSITKSM